MRSAIGAADRAEVASTMRKEPPRYRTRLVLDWRMLGGTCGPANGLQQNHDPIDGRGPIQAAAEGGQRRPGHVAVAILRREYARHGRRPGRGGGGGRQQPARHVILHDARHAADLRDRDGQAVGIGLCNHHRHTVGPCGEDKKMGLPKEG